MEKQFVLTLSDAQVKALANEIADPEFWVESHVGGVVSGVLERAGRNMAAIVADEVARLRGLGLAIPPNDDAIVLGAPIVLAAERLALQDAEERRAREEAEALALAPLTARQLRLGLVDNGIALADVSAALDALPEGPDKARAQIEWQFAATFERDHPLIGTVAGALGLDADQVDAMWRAAYAL